MIREAMTGSRQSDARPGLRGDAPPGMTLVGVFLFFGATMACYAAVTLLWPGTVLDRAWVLNPGAQRQLLPHRQLMGLTFVMLSTALALAGVGWFGRRIWGWRLTVVIIGAQLLGD